MKKLFTTLSFVLFLFLIIDIHAQNKYPENLFQGTIEAFSEVEEILNQDNGKFWDVNLYGPILFVDKNTRKFIANQNNIDKSFEITNGYYIGELPGNIPMANTAFDWDGIRWTMVMLPLPENRFDRNNLIIHELFHRIQPQIGFGGLKEQSNAHLDTYDGRVLLKLELEALKNSLQSTDKKTSYFHLLNAMSFRTLRQSDSTKENSENSLELNEGLAEYTGVMLSGRDETDIKSRFINKINNFYNVETFVRSFAYQTIPVYGYVISKTEKNWHKQIDKNTNLTDFFIKSFSFEPAKDKSYYDIAKANEYNYDEIIKEETEREQKRIQRIENYKTLFLVKPSLFLQFQKMNISFDPRNIVPIEGIGTVYPTMKVTDVWGILTVTKAALLSSNWSGVTLSEPEHINSQMAKGDGWELELNEGWNVEKNDEGYKLIKK